MKALNGFAKELGREINNRNAILNQKKSDLEVELTNIQKELDSLVPIKARAISYVPNKMLCPRCYIFEELAIEMKPIASESETDVFRCRHCSSEIEVEG